MGLFGKRFAAVWHLVPAAFVFSDLFLHFKILVSSTDVVDYQLPLWEVARQNFVNGELGLWNPYLMNGISLFSQGLTPILYPENWLLFLLPQSAFFLGFTFLAFVKFWLVGYFAYLWFRAELGHRGWALFASTIYQLCGFSLWTVAASNLLSLYFYSTLALYLIWTVEKRSVFRNYLFLTLVVVQLFYSANLVYEIYTLALVIILSVYRNWAAPRRNFLLGLVFLTCGLLAMPRWLPSWYEIQLSNRFPATFAGNFAELGLFLPRLFVPEIFGVSFWASFDVIKNLSSYFEPLGVQVHSHFPQFFGGLSALLVVTGWLTGAFPKRARFWGALTFLVLALLCCLQPLDTVARGLLHPIYHLTSLQIWLPAAFALFAAYVGRTLERKTDWLVSRQGTLAFLAALVSLYVLVVISLSLQKQYNIHWAWKFIAVATGLAALRLRFGWSLPVAFGAGILLFAKSDNVVHLSHLRELCLSLLGISLLASWNHQWRSNLKMIFIGIFLCTILAVKDEMFVLSTVPQSLELAALGLLKFAAIGFAAWQIFLGRRRWILPGAVLLLAVDLLPAAKIHTHLAMNPFWKQALPFPPAASFYRLPVYPDKENYRFNYPNSFLNAPLYRALYNRKEALSSYFAAYGISSYAGNNNLVSVRFDDYLRTMLAPIYPDNFRDMGKRGIEGVVEHERFLDLVGVRYDFRPEQGLFHERRAALSRFALFHSFEVIPSEKKILSRLLEKDFRPIQTLLLEKDPGVLALPLASEMVPARQKLEMTIVSPSGGILLFNDSYHPGWQAWVNGQPQEVLRANYNFMAVKLLPGTSVVKFQFVPPYFVLGKRLAGLGAGLFLLFCILLARGSAKIRHPKGVSLPIPVPG